MSDTKIKDGGPAFPGESWRIPAHPEEVGGFVKGPGMSLRDWFAGQSLMGILANPEVEKFRQRELDGKISDERQIRALVSECYDYANAMIAEREKGGKA